MIPIFPRGSRRSKGVPSGSRVFLRLLVGELGSRNLPKFSPMANGYTHTECYYTARQICTKDVWKRAVVRTDVLCHQISSTLPPKSPQNPILGDGPFNAKFIIEIALRKSHVNGATKLKLYSYIGIGKYLGCVKIFPFGGVRGIRPPNINLGPPDISETTRAR